MPAACPQSGGAGAQHVIVDGGGAPQNAITAFPMNLSTVPPSSAMAQAMAEKYWVS